VKVAFIGAGSTVFAKTLIGDLLSYPELSDGMTIALKRRGQPPVPTARRTGAAD